MLFLLCKVVKVAVSNLISLITVVTNSSATFPFALCSSTSREGRFVMLWVADALCCVLEQICADKNTSAGMKMTEMEPVCSLEGGGGCKP